jgi:excinuclease ABC subunit C
MIDGNGDLIYVGKAKDLRVRLLSYFRRRHRDRRASRIIRQTQSIAWEYTASEFGALLRELELIRRWKPRCNVQGQPHRRSRTFVCLGRRPAPYAFLCRRPPTGMFACFGPILAGRKAKTAVRWLNDVFQLRGCPRYQEMVFAEQGDLFPQARTAGCLRYEIGTCLGPCAAACSRKTYQEQVRAARAFLSGEDSTLLENLEREMKAAATALLFERAAYLREKLEAMRWLCRQVDRVRQARARHSFIYVVPGHDGIAWWYLIQHGCVVRALPAPQDPESFQATAALMESVYRSSHTPIGLGSAEKVDTVFLVAAWFRRYPQERRNTLQPAEAIATELQSRLGVKMVT